MSQLSKVLIILIACTSLHFYSIPSIGTRGSQSENGLNPPLGIYWPTKPSHASIIKDSGFNTLVFGYDTNESFNDPDYDPIGLLNDSETMKLQVIYELSYFLRWDDLTNLATNISFLKEYHCIKAWYIIDEPGWTRLEISKQITEVEIKAAAEIIRTEDDRPLFVQFSNQFIKYPDLFDDVPDIVDIVSTDPYPNMPYRNFSHTETILIALNEYASDKIPLWVVLTAQDSSVAHGDTGYDMPTMDEFWMDLAIACASNVSGINWFTFGDYDYPYRGIYDFPDRWNDFKSMLIVLSPIWDQLALSKQVEDGNDFSVRSDGTSAFIPIFNRDYFWNISINETEWFPVTRTLFINNPLPSNDLVVKNLRTGGTIQYLANDTGLTITLDKLISGDIIILSEVVPEFGNEIHTIFFSSSLMIAIVMMLVNWYIKDDPD
ncbi:MAG: hypothetical protein ACXAEU_15535 [Candidatus Hodarchaeales archaeon]|jgi:hypothetical protein